MSPFHRSELMMAFSGAIMQNINELVALECNDNGKTPAEAFGDFAFSSMIIKYYAGLCNTINGRTIDRRTHDMHWQN